MQHYIDIHTHVLHDMDDGPEHLETSLAILEEELRQNVATVIATPHFKDFDSSIDEFIRRRTQRIEELRRSAQEKGIAIPAIRAGAEVQLSCNLAEVDGIEKLAIEGTRYILIEMPYAMWYDWMFDVLYALIADKNLIPVMAHIERYGNISRKMVEKLASMEVYFQINADSLMDRSCRGLVAKLIRQNLVHFMGSDVHNMSNRSVRLQEGFKHLTKKYTGELAHYLNMNAHLLIEDQYIERYSSNYHQMVPVSWFKRMFRKPAGKRSLS